MQIMLNPRWKNYGIDKMEDINSVSKFWDDRPCNIKHSNSEFGTKEYFDEVECRKYFVESHIPKFAEFEKWKDKKVLEIGCGIGTDAVNFARAGAEYTGIELSKNSLDITLKRFTLFNLEGTFYQGNAEDLISIVPVQKYDLIYSFGVLHHTPYPKKIIRAIEFYMGRNSEFKLMLYAKNSWKAMMIDAGLEQPEAQKGCPIADMYTRKEIEKLLENYDILDISQTHIFPYVVEKYINYEYEVQPWFKTMPSKMFQTLEKNLGWHTLITCMLKEEYVWKKYW